MSEKTFLLNNGVSMPAVGYGTYLISNEHACDAVAGAIRHGYRHVDTASGYHNEQGVGAGIAKGLSEKGLKREDMFITTKLWPGNPAWGDTVKGYEDTLTAFQESLSNLNLDYVDLYLIHAPFGGEKRLEQWQALIDLNIQGRCKAIGVSNYAEAHVREIENAGLAMPQANQLELHPWTQKPDLVTYLEERRILPIAYSSLAPLSTWRVEQGQDSAKTDEMRAEGGDQDSQFAPIAAKYGVTEAQLLLRWGVQSGYPVLPRSMNSERMKQNRDLFNFSINETDMLKMSSFDRGGGFAWAPGDPTQAD